MRRAFTLIELAMVIVIIAIIAAIAIPNLIEQKKRRDTAPGVIVHKFYRQGNAGPGADNYVRAGWVLVIVIDGKTSERDVDYAVYQAAEINGKWPLVEKP